MNGQLNLELYTQAIYGLNDSFEKLGQIIHDNIYFIAADLDKNIKKEGEDELANKMKNTLKGFEANYNQLEKFYDELIDDLKEDINQNEFRPFLEHAKTTFPQYIQELNNSIISIKNLEIENENIDLVLDELETIINRIISIFINLKNVSNSCLNENI